MQPQNPELEAFIRRVPVFRNLPPPMFDVVRKACQIRQYAENEFLFQQGEPTKGMVIIIRGEAALMQVGPDGLKRQVGMVRPGQFINQQALFGDGLESASLKAVLPVTALVLSRRDMSALMSYYKELPSLMGLAAQSQTFGEVQFKTQRPNEQILLQTHRHPWAFARWFVGPVIIVVGLWLMAASIPALSCTLMIVSLLVGGGSLLYLYVEWANDAIIITDQRVVRIDKTVFPPRETINEVLVHSIQEARADIPGTDPFAVLFNYGVVDIRTGGQAGNFHLDFIPNPEAIQQLIIYDHQIRRTTMQQQERQEMRRDLENWISGQPVTAAPKPKPTAVARVRGILGTVETKADGSIIFRKHWIVWLRGAMPALSILGLALLMAVATLFIPFLQKVSPAMLTVTFVLCIIGGLWLWYADWDWRHDYMHLQDTTITILHQRPFWMQNERDQVLLKQVDNVVAETKGWIARLLGYGTIRLSLVGADQHKVFHYTSEPLAVQAEITRRQAAIKQQEQASQEQQEKERLGEYFQMYHEMMTGQGGQPMPTPASRPPTMKTGEVPTVNPSIPTAPTPPQQWPQPTGADVSSGWPSAPVPNAPIPTVPQENRKPSGWMPSASMPAAQDNRPSPAWPPTAPTPNAPAPQEGRQPSGWTPTTPMPSAPPPPTPPANRPPLVATGGQPDRNRPPRIPIDRPSLSPGKPYAAPRVDQPPTPPQPPEMPQTPPAPPSPRFPRRSS